MAYLEVWSSGILVTRRRVDEEKARKGCKVRLGSAGEARLVTGQSQKIGDYEVRMFEGEPPEASGPVEKDLSKAQGEAKAALPLDFSVGAPSYSVDDTDLPPDVEGYEIIERLGQGGMGAVWRAEQLSTKRPVALKLMASPRFASEKAQLRFEREVELTARLDHPNIARIYDSGLRHGMYYYAMELVDGVPLDRYVKSKGLSKNQILALMQKVCQAVLYAHLRAVVHRDLKPANILVDSDGQPHVLDFGLAKALLEDDEALTISIEGQIAGTPAYMSPEQAAGRHNDIDTRTDVFSLGVILYELLTGQSPHDRSGSMIDMLRRITEGKVRRPREINKSIDSELEAILLKSLAVDPDNRYASAGALAKDIASYLDEEPLDARVPTTFYFLRKKAHKYRVQAAAILIALLLVLGAMVAAYTKGVQRRVLSDAMDRALDFNDLPWSDLEVEVSGSDPEDALAALSILRDRYVAAQEQISQLNHELGQRKPPVAVRRIDLRSGPPMASTALVRNPSVPGGVTSWTLETYGHRGRITRLVYSPDGSRLASAGQDGTIRIWDSQSGQLVHALVDPNADMSDLAWSVDGRNLGGTGAADPARSSVWAIEPGWIRSSEGSSADVDWQDDSARCWPASSGAPAQTLHEVTGLWNIQLPLAWASIRESITALALSSERQQFACGDEDGTIRILDAASGELLHTQPAAWCGPVQSVEFSPDGQTLATCSAAGSLCLWQADRWEPVRKCETGSMKHGAASTTGAIAWAPDNVHIARADNSRMIVEVLDMHSGDVVRALSGNDDRIIRISWSSEGRLIAAATESGNLYLWDMESGSGTPSIAEDAHADAVSALEWIPQSRNLITAGRDGEIKIWESRNGTLSESFGRSTSPITCAALSQNGSVLASCSLDGRVRLWNARGGWTSNLLRTDPNDTETSQSTFTAIAWSPNGALLATGDSAAMIQIWDAGSRQATQSFAADCQSIGSLAWSSDGRLLLCGGTDGTVRVWDAGNNFQEHVVLLPLSGPAEPGIAVSTAGDYRGLPRIADRLVYALRTTEGQMTLSPADLKSQYGWVNEPWQVGLYRPGVETVERIYVKADSEGPYDGKSWATAFRDLQKALSMARPNTEIWVSAGVYKPDRDTGARTASFRLKNGVRLLGGFAGTETSSHQRDPNSNETVLSGDLNGDDGPDFANNDENSYHVVTSFQTDPNAVLDGFVITSGNANGPKDPKGPRSTHRCGGALHNDKGDPSVINCALRHNSAMEKGGGIYNDRGSRLKVSNCTFASNSSLVGGGMANDSGTGPTLIDCRFIDNRANRGSAAKSDNGIGGGVYNGGNMTLTNCTFAGNTADLGGGIYSRDGHSPKLTNCKFIRNSALRGGGMYAYGRIRPILADCTFEGNTAAQDGGGMTNTVLSNPVLINCVFRENRAKSAGGGMHNQSGSRPILANCVLSGNLAENGAGMMNSEVWNDPESDRFFHSSPTLVNCILSMNKADANGGGIWNTEEGKSTLANCILWGNSDSGGMDESAQIYNSREGQISAMDYCCIQGWTGELGGVGNFGADPQFIDVDGPDNKIGTEDDNLQLRLGSPCIDTGDNAAVPTDTLDLDGDGNTNEPMPFDLDSQPRIINSTVDIGAYESD